MEPHGEVQVSLNILKNIKKIGPVKGPFLTLSYVSSLTF
jgi:hypothetical protein